MKRKSTLLIQPPLTTQLPPTTQPNSGIDVSRGSDNGTLMLVITDSNAPINPTPPVYGLMCMGYVGGNCTNPNTWCTAMYGGSASDYIDWDIKCVSDPLMV